MKILVTGSAGHLGEALLRKLRESEHTAIGADRLRSPFTDLTGDFVDESFARDCAAGVDAVIHAATLHKPHVATHTRRQFVDANITATLNLLDAARDSGASRFVFTSTTSTFGHALTPADDAPAAWIDEDVKPVAKNIYGVTKLAAEDLCELYALRFGLPCVVLRTSRFFPEPDDDAAKRAAYEDANAKVNELLFRRVDIADVVDAHLLALEKAPVLKFGCYIVSATTPFTRDDLAALHRNAPAVLARRCPGYEAVYAARRWRMYPRIERVYDNARARVALGWTPRYDFAYLLHELAAGRDTMSPLARAVGIKGYHGEVYRDGLYPT